MVLAVAWAVYLIPKALKHHDEVARTRSIDRFSTAMRVLARREPVNRRDARLVVAPPRAAGNPRVLARPGSPPPDAQRGGAPVAVTSAPRCRRRLPARRRTGPRPAGAGILTFLLLCTAGTAAAAALGYAPWWSLAVPGGLTLAYLCSAAPRCAASPCTTSTWSPTARAGAEDLLVSSVTPRGAARAEVRTVRRPALPT